MTILVTASTGHVGSALVQRLTLQGHGVRALVHDPQRELPAPTELLETERVGSRPLEQMLDGIDAVYLACGNVPGQVAFETSVIDAAARVGVPRLVKLSARGATLGSPVAFWDWHAVIERHLASSGVPATLLQPSYLMTNLLAAADQVQHAGMLFAPAGQARISMIDPIDVAAVAATTLLEDGHDGRTYVLTGPQAPTYDEVAAVLTGATGRQIGYLDVSPEAARSSMADAGVPDFAASQIVNVFDALRRGDQESTTNVVSALTGGPGRTLGEFVLEHVELFDRRGVGAVSH